MEVQIDFTNDPIPSPAPSPHEPETGAEVEFRGIVRATELGRPITGLEYEAHIPMARHHLERIIARLATASPCHSVHFIHRLGWVPVGEASLYIRVRATHRTPAFTLCSGLIDQLKKHVPIWKLYPGPPIS